ncbi:phosphoribosylanthranilate isomerase [Dysgonomonas alginatilytica]|uniref:N-(5'-phosphoribosyl)anthranilate isomerase n=2 Tax=Dysgonomonas alginatilytica TaxID=1605892 RepID=A0A2V3PRM2_9BACT|nr:phosphoribosylanthranilate isomerase [Dysgonomonas alginatilytica]
MKIKVCGMKNPENILALAKLPIDYMGLIFYPKSPRYIQSLDSSVLNILPDNIDRVGVFVNENIESVLEQINKYKLSVVQLHGSEPIEYCSAIRAEYPNLTLLKAFNISEEADFFATKEYENVCDFLLFDTKTPQHGGSGIKFDWSILNQYKGKLPFFLSGGISIEDVKAIKDISHPKLYALDLNSKFELEPGLKNIELLEQFINQLKNE